MKWLRFGSKGDIETLISAMEEKDSDRVKGLIDRYPEWASDKDKMGIPVLVYATYIGDKEILLHLLTKEVSPDIEAPDGSFPLGVAVQEGRIDLLQLLLERGASIDKKDKFGATPLMYAAQKQDTEAASLLIQYGANVNERDTEGDTVLIYAVNYFADDVIRLLHQAGAQITAQNHDGLTAIDKAWKPEIRNLLEELWTA